METPHEQTEHRGYHINIYYDGYPKSPRDWDNLGTFYTAHSRYRPEKDFDKHFDIDQVCENGRPGVFRKSFLEKYIALNIYLFDHTGQTVKTTPFSCPWDSRWFGMVAVDIAKVKKEYDWKVLTAARRRKIESYLQGEVEVYDNYLRGEVYRFTITSASDPDEVIDRCGGYYGDSGMEQIREECRHTIDSHIGVLTKQAWLERLRLQGPELPFPEFTLSIS